MECAEPEKELHRKDSSYRYWVRQDTEEAAPAPIPRKISNDDLAANVQQQTHLGSAWNQAGTWEERSLNAWALKRVKELLGSVGSIKFSEGSAFVTKVSSCSGDATMVTVRNKKRVGYSFDISVKFEGELVAEESKKVRGTLRLPDASFGELDDLQMEVELSKDEDVLEGEKSHISEALKAFLPLFQEKLREFELELKAR